MKILIYFFPLQLIEMLVSMPKLASCSVAYKGAYSTDPSKITEKGVAMLHKKGLQLLDFPASALLATIDPNSMTLLLTLPISPLLVSSFYTPMNLLICRSYPSLYIFKFNTLFLLRFLLLFIIYLFIDLLLLLYSLFITCLLIIY